MIRDQLSSQVRPPLSLPLLNVSLSATDFVDNMLGEAMRLQASDIHLAIYRSSARLRFRLDGILRGIESRDFLFQQYSAVSNRIKVLAAIDIAKQRQPQDGNFMYSCKQGNMDVRVSVLPAITGERFVLRIIGRETLKLDFIALGMRSEQIEHLHRVAQSNQGMMLATGPTGSGKTTTLYAILHILNSEEKNIVTVENPVERQIDGIGQVQICDEIGLNFSSSLRAFLRQDPEVIMVGEIRDYETADIAVKAALTGHLVLSTLHTGNAATTLIRLVSLGVASSLINAALKLIISQRLLRLTCLNCKVSEQLPDYDTPTFYGSGCEQCSYTGYKGRCGIFEMLVVNEKLRQVLSDNFSPQHISSFLVGGKSLQQIGAALLREGTISFVEYQRTLLDVE